MADAGGTVRIHNANETPPRVSVYDVFQQVFGIGANHTARTFTRMLENFRGLRKEVNPLWINFECPGQGQRTTPAADARGIVRIIIIIIIIMLLRCRAAAPVRAKAADVSHFVGYIPPVDSAGRRRQRTLQALARLQAARPEVYTLCVDFPEVRALFPGDRQRKTPSRRFGG